MSTIPEALEVKEPPKMTKSLAERLEAGTSRSFLPMYAPVPQRSDVEAPMPPEVLINTKSRLRADKVVMRHDFDLKQLQFDRTMRAKLTNARPRPPHFGPKPKI